MTVRRSLATCLVVVVVAFGLPTRAQQATGAGQATGSLGGRTSDETKGAYAEYAVQLRDLLSNQVVGPLGLDARGEFAFDGLPLSRKFLVELVDLKKSVVVCTEGPYALVPTAAAKLDVNVDCGKTPAALWLLAAGAGTAAAIALAQTSPSQ